MDYKKANVSFLLMILSTLVLTLLFTFYAIIFGGEMSILVNNVLCELVILIPALIVILFSGESIRGVIPLKFIRPTSALMVILYVICLFPLVTFVNSVSMLFVENVVDSISDQIVSTSMWSLLLSMGIIGPFIEEVVFRGMFYHSYRRTGRIVGSIVLSSILFGMMHLNYNQFAYGAVMGVMFCLLVEATGSILSSFLAHAFFNSAEVILLFASNSMIGNAEDYLNTMEAGNYYMTIGIYFVLAVIFTAVAVCIVYKIAEMEGRREVFARIKSGQKQGYKLITIPLVIAIAISVAYMTFLAMATSMMGAVQK